ncbi:hydantoinase/oxoprolinase family protein [Demequina sp. NBRC 110054]|uniref:hydantoinase/oxoprolinase family protein n=1 Tax=Demequina sp. NBRC 110054 TaxID=1570343 RepID=UPI0009FDF154|nr:hydantoinase/oxoprolinase family protein [Demequina sp. NBRC 110054]
MRVSFDIGGTFTDLVLLDETSGNAWLGKSLTTYDDFSRAIETGIRQVLGAAGADEQSITDSVVGATTLITNALIERRGAKTALITTAGFVDTIEIGREWRYDLYDPRLQLPDPLVAATARYGVRGRLMADGSEVEPIDAAEIEAIADRLREDGVEAVAVCLLHSYASPVHEERVGEILAERLPGVPVTLSSRLVPVIREYERTVTTVANSYVRPVAGEHFEDIERALGSLGVDQSLVMMQSNGGVIRVPTARTFPLRLLESGPAAGAIGAAHVGASLGMDRLIAFDMGGTTAKVCIIEGGTPAVKNSFEVGRVHRLKPGSGLPVTMPVVEMIEIGAGGGSIASIDSLGLLQVGPHSAGSRPGPAGYGLGGEEPTVTDADIALGYLDPDYFLGGTMSLDVDASKAALASRIGDAFDGDPIASAAAVVRVVNEHMALAIQVHATEQGHDPRDFAMMAFGGAAPVHAARVARILGVREVVIPAAAGVLSATGLLVAPPMVEASRTRIVRLDAWDEASVSDTFAQLEAQAEEELAAPADRFEHFVDMRYVGQGFDIEVPVGREDGPAEYAEKFAVEYRRIYGVTPDYPRAEVVTFRVRGYGAFETPRMSRTDTGVADRVPTATSRAAWFPETGVVEVPVLDMLRAGVDEPVTGPAVFQLPESTAVVGPGDVATLDAQGNLRIVIATEGEQA